MTRPLSLLLRSCYPVRKLVAGRGPLPAANIAARFSSSQSMSEEEIKNFQAQKANKKEELRLEAGFLTRSLYRTCLRSVRLIRPGNGKDEEEFQEREKKRMEEEKSFTSRDNDDVRMGMFSMLPPVDRADELRSRADYYHQFARENLMQEIDVMPLEEGAIGQLTSQDVEKFIFLLKKGENDRQWLLQDMEFPDRYESSFPKERLQQFEQKAMDYIRKSRMVQQQKEGGGSIMYQQDVTDDGADGDDAFWDDDDDVPQWIRDKYPDLIHGAKPAHGPKPR